MSYILDALRKSELERQKSTGQGISLPYPATIKQERESRLIPALLGIAAACAGIAIWWILSGTTDKPAPTPPIAIVPQPKLPAADAAMESSPKPLKHMDSVRKERVAEAPRRQPTANLVASAPIAAAPSKPDSDPLKGLPPLEVAGFMHNEQGGNMAIINDRLMKEGDEVSPGLRVEKIKDDAVIFSYKGYVFSR
jgi:general secretion pathway protein B